MKNRCVIYARTGNRHLCDDPIAKEQVERLRSFARANQLEIASIVVAESEGNSRDRPSISFLYQAVEKYRPTFVFVDQVSRLSSNANHAMEIVDQIRLRGASVKALDPCMLKISSTEVLPQVLISPHGSGSPKRCCLYARLGGSENEQNKYVMESQLEVLRAFAQSANLLIVKEVAVYESGTNSERGSIHALCRGGKQREYDCVLVTDLNRLARSVLGIVDVARQLKESGVDVLTPRGDEKLIPFLPAIYHYDTRGGDAFGPRQQE